MAGEFILPDPLRKRDLLFSRDVNRSVDYVALGDAYLELGRLSEAVQFYHRGEARDKILAVKKVVIEGGDSALLTTIAITLGDSVETEDWAALAAAALQKGMFAAAAEAFEKAGQPEKASQAREKFAALLGQHMPPDPTADPAREGPEGPGQAERQTKTGG